MLVFCRQTEKQIDRQTMQKLYASNLPIQVHKKRKLAQLKVPIAPNYKGVCLQNTSKAHSYHLKIW